MFHLARILVIDAAVAQRVRLTLQVFLGPCNEGGV
jgi:hypothetical protein